MSREAEAVLMGMMPSELLDSMIRTKLQKSGKYFDEIKNILDAEAGEDTSGRCTELNIIGVGQYYFVILPDRMEYLFDTPPEKVDVIFNMNEDTFLNIYRGAWPPQEALGYGLITITGSNDMNMLDKLYHGALLMKIFDLLRSKNIL